MNLLGFIRRDARRAVVVDLYGEAVRIATRRDDRLHQKVILSPEEAAAVAMALMSVHTDAHPCPACILKEQLEAASLDTEPAS